MPSRVSSAIVRSALRGFGPLLTSGGSSGNAGELRVTIPGYAEHRRMSDQRPARSRAWWIFRVARSSSWETREISSMRVSSPSILELRTAARFTQGHLTS